MTWENRGKRKGAKRLPEGVRKAVLAKSERCFFAFPGICTWPNGRKEVHHVLDAEDGGTDDPSNLVGACKACHQHHSAQVSQRRSVAKQNEWKRKPQTWADYPLD